MALKLRYGVRFAFEKRILSLSLFPWQLMLWYSVMHFACRISWWNMLVILLWMIHMRTVVTCGNEFCAFLNFLTCVIRRAKENFDLRGGRISFPRRPSDTLMVRWLRDSWNYLCAACSMWIRQWDSSIVINVDKDEGLAIRCWIDGYSCSEVMRRGVTEVASILVWSCR